VHVRGERFIESPLLIRTEKMRSRERQCDGVVVMKDKELSDPPIHFSGPTNFFGAQIDFTNHQFETSVLDPPMSSDPLSNHQTVVKRRDRVQKNCEGSSQFSEFVKDAERGNLDVEIIRSSASPGSTCLSVAKVPPDNAAHISPSLGGLRERERERERGSRPLTHQVESLEHHTYYHDTYINLAEVGKCLVEPHGRVVENEEPIQCICEREM
jgi:hypothetical protein